MSDCEPEPRTGVSAVPVVTDVPVSPSSLVTECYEDVSWDSDREVVEPQSVESGSQGVGASDGPTRRRSQSDVHFDASEQDGQQHIRTLQYKWEK